MYLNTERTDDMESKVLSGKAREKIEECLKCFDSICRKSFAVADIDYEVDYDKECAYIYLQTPVRLSVDLDDSIALREIVDSVDLYLTDELVFEPTEETDIELQKLDRKDIVLKATVQDIFLNVLLTNEITDSNQEALNG